MSVSVTGSNKENTVSSLIVPNSLLYCWHLIIVRTSGDKDFFSRSLNRSIVGKSLMLKSNKLLEERVRVQANRVYSKVTSAENQGRKEKIKAPYTTVYIYTNDVVRPLELYEKIQQLR